MHFFCYTPPDTCTTSFFIIAFANFAETELGLTQTFSEWLKVCCPLNTAVHRLTFLQARTEIWKYVVCNLTWLCLTYPCSQIMFLRKTYGSRLNIFQPVNDLSSLSKSGAEGRALVAGQKNDIAIAGGQILGDEYSDHVVKVSIFYRRGLLSEAMTFVHVEPEWYYFTRRVIHLIFFWLLILVRH